MKIAIDTSCLAINPTSGLSEVVRNLIIELPSVEEGNQFILFYNYCRSQKNKLRYKNAITDEQILRLPRKLVNLSWKFDWFPADIFLPAADIYHSLHIQIPPSNRSKKILTVHDCRFLTLPDLYSSKAVESYRQLMKISLRRSDKIVTVSNHTRNELLYHFRISENRIKVIYNGFNSFVPDKNTSENKLRHFMQNKNLPEVYIFFIGVLDPRKNLGRLIQALAILKEKKSDIPDLIIAGISHKQWEKSNEAKKAADMGFLKNIHVIDVVEKDILFGILKKASVLCYPSLYEGFGFPPLEAMSQGIPVLAGRNSSIPEVTGNAACLVDAMSVDDIMRGLEKIVNDNEYRQKLIECGYNQVKKFSWQRAASEYINLYKSVLAT